MARQHRPDLMIRWLVNLAATQLRRYRFLDRQSQRFWSHAPSGHLLSGSYYDDRRRLMHEWLGALPHMRCALDVGCGEGDFTFVAARYANHVHGFDLNDGLIAVASINARARGIDNVQFSAGDLLAIPSGSFDLVGAAAVTSGIIDPAKFKIVVTALCKRVALGGHLLTVDTLGVARTYVRNFCDAYVACYRHVDRYTAEFKKHGLQPLRQEVVQRFSDPRTAIYMVLFRKDDQTTA